VFAIFRNPCRRRHGLGPREFLTAGAAGLARLPSGDLLRAEAAAGNTSSVKAIVNVHLDGGPLQMDTINPKPDAAGHVEKRPHRIAVR
jgi:hypothetical protein